MDFEYPFMLWLLLFVPVLLFLFWLALRHNNAMRERFGNWEVLQRLIPDFAPKRNPLKFGLVLAAYILLVIAVANPRIGSRTRKVKRDGVDVYIALDISRSMWAQDVTPKGMDRLEKARLFSLKLIDELRGDRIGLIFFAGEAFIQMPMTLDYSSAQLFLNEGLGDFEIMQGTAMDELVKLAGKNGSEEATEDDKKRQRALIIISDGEDHEKQGVAAAREGKNNGVTTYCIGVGSSEAAPIPLTREEANGFHTDKAGTIVQTAANKVWLKEMAEAGAGKFFDIEDGDAVFGALRRALDKLEKQEFNEQQFDEYQTFYQFFVFLALLLLGVEFIISYRKKAKTVKNNVAPTSTENPEKKEETPISMEV